MEKPSGWSFIGAIALSTALVAAAVAVLLFFDLQNQVIIFLRWLEARGWWAAVLFVLVMAAVVILLVPGVLLTTGAGFVFGVVTGTVCVVVGTTLGAVVAFVLARRFFGNRARDYVLENPRLAMLDANIPSHAWKIVLFSRLIPFFPSKLANYFFGLTSISLRSFTAGSLVGFTPLTLHNVYLGAIAAELTTQGLRTADFGAWDWALYGCGFALAVVAVLYLGRWAWRTLDSNQDERPGMAQVK